MELVQNARKKRKITPRVEPDRSPEPEFEPTQPDKKHGKATYRHCGDCFECGDPVYKCVTDEHKDDLMGSALASFVPVASNRAPAAYCQKCYRKWQITAMAGFYPPDPGWRYEK